MIKRFIRKDKENFYGGEISDKEMIEGMLLLTENDFKVKKINVNELDDICII